VVSRAGGARAFVVDFAAPRSKLVVEVDGGYHAARAGADRRRDAQLARMGFRVLRIEAERVRRDLPGVLELIRAALVRGA
jgi:very-short-patch-repair endonuclease